MYQPDDVVATAAGTVVDGRVVNTFIARNAKNNSKMVAYGLSQISGGNCSLNTRFLALAYKASDTKEVGDEVPFTSLTGFPITPNESKYSLMARLKVAGRPATGVDFSVPIPPIKKVALENSGLMTLRFMAETPNVRLKIGDLVGWTTPDPSDTAALQYVEEQNQVLRNPSGMLPPLLEPIDGFSYLHPVTAALERFLRNHKEDPRWWSSEKLKMSAHPLDKWAYLKLTLGLAAFINSPATAQQDLMATIAKLYSGNIRTLSRDLQQIVGNYNVINPIQGADRLAHRRLLNASAFSAEADYIIHKFNMDRTVGVAMTDANPKENVLIMKTGY